MTRKPLSNLARLLSGVLCALLILCGLPAIVTSQDKVPDGKTEVEQNADDDDAADDAAADDSPEGKTEAKTEAKTEEAAPLSERLVSEFGLSPDDVSSTEALATLEEKTAGDVEALKQRVQTLEQARLVDDAKLQSLREQFETLPAEARSVLGTAVGRRQVSLARIDAELAAVAEARSGEEELLTLLGVQRVRLRELATKREQELAFLQQQTQDAEEAEKEAERALAEARERERQERDEALRKLLQTQRELAEQILKATREYNDQIASIREETREGLAVFEEQKAELLPKIEDLPQSPTPEARRESVDPIFDELVSVRREAQKRYFSALDDYDSAASDFEAASEALELAREELTKEEAREEQFAGSELWERRVEVAEARVRLREQQLEAARAVREAYRERANDYSKHVKFFSEGIRELVPKVSEKTHHEFFEIFSDQNWNDAVASLRHRVRQIYEDGQSRLDQAISLTDDLFSFTVWGWVGGLFWRLLLVLVVIRLVFPAVPPLIKRMTEMLFRRRFFRLRPTLTIKLVEVLGAIAKPALLYFVITFIGRYVAATFTELDVLLWSIDAIFIYWIATDFLSVIVLPRWHRLEQGKASTDSIVSIEAEEAEAAADLTGMSLARAQKLMRSAKVVIAFWILAAYIPAFVLKITGMTVIWYIVQQGATWGFIAIVYWVISTWRNDIAAIFERLARERMPKAVKFVNNNKDRPWGVLIIGVASIYVIALETVRVARKYILNTQWFKRASTFAFRKKIELQQRDRKDDAGPKTAPSALPDDFLVHFEDRPLYDEDYVLDQSHYVDEILTHLTGWSDHRRQGSLAIVGETGMGRTTVLKMVQARLAEEAGATPAEETAQVDDIGDFPAMESDAPAPEVSDVAEGDTAETATSAAADVENADESPESAQDGSAEEAVVEAAADEQESVSEVPAFPVVFRRVEGKLDSEPTVLEFLADVFDIEDIPERRQDFIDQIRQCGTRIVILDDCHHFFVRRIGGFTGLDALLDIVNLTDESHFWVLSFNDYAWSYVNRVRERSHYFGDVVRLEPWDDSSVQEFIERRCNASGYAINFSDLVVTHDESEGHDYFYEVVKSARGYFRYLAEFSGGNPRVTTVYWLRSLHHEAGTDTLHVSLFRRPNLQELLGMTDDYWFVLTAIAQHGELNAEEIASIINLDEGFCALAMDYFEEKDIVTIDPASRRGRLTPLYFRQVLQHLSNSNFLYT